MQCLLNLRGAAFFWITFTFPKLAMSDASVVPFDGEATMGGCFSNADVMTIYHMCICVSLLVCMNNMRYCGSQCARKPKRCGRQQ